MVLECSEEQSNATIQRHSIVDIAHVPLQFVVQHGNCTVFVPVATQLAANPLVPPAGAQISVPVAGLKFFWIEPVHVPLPLVIWMTMLGHFATDTQ